MLDTLKLLDVVQGIGDLITKRMKPLHHRIGLCNCPRMPGPLIISALVHPMVPRLLDDRRAKREGAIFSFAGGSSPRTGQPPLETI
jgi:hypothetical protein